MMGTAFHAVAEGDGKAALARLTEEERQIVASWKLPADVDLGHAVLRYADAHKEIPCGITAEGEYCAKDAPNAVAFGTADMCWHEGQVLYLGDIKKTEWTSEPESLQLAGYALALASKFGAESIACGIWAATEGRWWWGPTISLWSPEGGELLDRVLHAARNTEGDFAVGGHCRECWARSSCPAYLIPPEMAETSLAPFVGGGQISNADALRVKLLVDRAKTTIERVDKELKALADRQPIVDDAAGKQYGPIKVAGRTQFQTMRFKNDHPELADEYTRRGKESTQYRWTNIK